MEKKIEHFRKIIKKIIHSMMMDIKNKTIKVNYLTNKMKRQTNCPIFKKKTH
jgi:hypothetical protein